MEWILSKLQHNGKEILRLGLQVYFHTITTDYYTDDIVWCFTIVQFHLIAFLPLGSHSIPVAHTLHMHAIKKYSAWILEPSIDTPYLIGMEYLVRFGMMIINIARCLTMQS